ncbi:tetratricopeptide repeat protein [Streptomyces sp. NPDC001903]|uniref:tetratricopeptide repeat protein n=1 Tax=Streptomyces sp. NPDC001903 TaxID=3364622 RepID=UPI00368C37E3
MHSDAGLFTDREEPLAAFDRLMSAGASPARTLVYWGVSGQGKSSLLRHIREGRAASRRCELIDLDQLLAVDAHSGELGRDLATVLVDSIARVIANWSARPFLARRRYARFRSRVRAAASAAPTYVNTHVQATENSSVSGTSVHVDARQARGAVDRDVLTDELCRLARGLRRRRCVLMLDTSERLRLLTDATPGSSEHGDRQEGVGQWFGGVLLPRLLEEARGLRVVLAGREPVEHLPAHIVAERVELTEWTLEHTSQYLDSCGLDARKLSRPVHTVCRGVPVWTALVAELARHGRDADEAVTPQWLAESAAGRAAHEWLPNQFMRRLPREQRRVVMASATLRSVSKEAVAMLLEGTPLSPEWYETLCGYSFMRVVQEPQGRPERRMHELVRLAVLTYLDREEPSYRQALHERAAAYFAVRDSFMDEAYHRFATGDATCVNAWLERRRELARVGDTDEVVRLVEIVTAPEQAPHTFRHFPAVAAAAALTGGRIALDQDRDDDAESLLRQACDSFRGAGNKKGQAEALKLLGQVAERGGSDEAVDLYERALRIDRSLGRKKPAGHLLRTLARLRTPSDPDAAARMFKEARALLLAAGDHICAADALRRRADLRRRTGGASQWAEGAYRKALEEQRAIGDGIGRARTMKSLAIMLAESHGHEEEAESLYREAAGLFKEAGNSYAANDTLNRLCTLLRGTGRAEEAEAYYRTLLAEHREEGERHGEAVILHNLATLLIDADRPQEAEPLLWRSVEINRSLGHPGNEAGSLISLAQLARSDGGSDAEERLLAQAADLADAHEDPVVRSQVLHARAHFASRRHLPEEADALFHEELGIMESLGDRGGEAGTLKCLGHLAMRERRFADAESYFVKALRIQEERGNREGRATVLVLLGDAALHTKGEKEAAARYEKAVNLLGGSAGGLPEVHALRDLAILTLRRGVHEESNQQEAIRLFERSLAIALEVGDEDCGLLAWTSLAALGAWSGDREAEAREILERVMVLIARKYSAPIVRIKGAVARNMLGIGALRSAPNALAHASYTQLYNGWQRGLRQRLRVLIAVLRSPG